MFYFWDIIFQAVVKFEFPTLPEVWYWGKTCLYAWSYWNHIWRWVKKWHFSKWDQSDLLQNPGESGDDWMPWSESYSYYRFHCTGEVLFRGLWFIPLQWSQFQWNRLNIINPKVISDSSWVTATTTNSVILVMSSHIEILECNAM
jgi:hypothetical protein